MVDNFIVCCLSLKIFSAVLPANVTDSVHFNKSTFIWKPALPS